MRRHTGRETPRSPPTHPTHIESTVAAFEPPPSPLPNSTTHPPTHIPSLPENARCSTTTASTSRPHPKVAPSYSSLHSLLLLHPNPSSPQPHYTQKKRGVWSGSGWVGGGLHPHDDGKNAGPSYPPSSHSSYWPYASHTRLLFLLLLLLRRVPPPRPPPPLGPSNAGHDCSVSGS